MVLTRFFSLKTIINDSYRKNPDIHVLSEDEIKELEEKIQKVTDKFVKEIDKAVDEKSKEILTV